MKQRETTEARPQADAAHLSSGEVVERRDERTRVRRRGRVRLQPVVGYDECDPVRGSLALVDEPV